VVLIVVGLEKRYPAGRLRETAEAKLLVAAVEENARRYSRMVTDQLRDWLAEVREQLKAPRAA
jgi:hypothetical protein